MGTNAPPVLAIAEKRRIFTFYGYTREWRARDGVPAPKEEVAVLFSLPGGLVATGKTTDEAFVRLCHIVDRTAALSKLSPDLWWAREFSKLNGVQAGYYFGQLNLAAAEGILDVGAHFGAVLKVLESEAEAAKLQLADCA